MLKTALISSRREASAAAIWAELADIEAQINAARNAMAEFEAASGEAILEAMADHGAVSMTQRREARRTLQERVDDIKDLERAKKALAERAKAAEAREKQIADAGAWAQIDGLLRKRAAVANKMDRATVELATLYAEGQGLEREISNLMPRDQRPNQWPKAGWDTELGRGIALRLKLLQPAFDGLANGCAIYVPRDWPTIAGLVELAHKNLTTNRK